MIGGMLHASIPSIRVYSFACDDQHTLLEFGDSKIIRNQDRGFYSISKNVRWSRNR
jgi:hypothetical protein